jgi:predicted 3-demethylubiquinone-9 3-methyltransferase (glyoxalase superfamily)
MAKNKKAPGRDNKKAPALDSNQKKALPIGRELEREIKNKFTEEIKALSQHMDSQGRVSDDFLGYKVPVAGEFKDKWGIPWQIQAHAICSKNHKIKERKVVPMIRKWAIGLKFRALIKYFIDWSNS